MFNEAYLFDMNQQVAIAIWNDRPHLHIVWIEPWGDDYTMLPKQKLTVTTSGPDSGSGPWFALVETDGNTQVFVERGDYPQVEVDGIRVEGGHNRQAAKDAGVWRG